MYRHYFIRNGADMSIRVGNKTIHNRGTEYTEKNKT
jgi:hypothetical protein